MVKSMRNLVDGALDRIVRGKAASASCTPYTYTRCVVSGVCSGGHSRQRCYVAAGCGTVCEHIGCC